jgi:hypothetical protein
MIFINSLYQKSPPRQLGNKNNTKKRVANYDNSFFVHYTELFIRHAEFISASL